MTPTPLRMRGNPLFHLDILVRALELIGGRRRQRALVILLAMCLAFGGGCVHRRLMVNSDPPGALVLLEGEEVGYTPCAIDFTYYGTREITLVKDGYESLVVMQKVRTPWYQVFPLEFVTDNLSPVKINDRREFTYRLRPQVIVPTQELLDRAEGLRRESQVPGAERSSP